MRSSSWLANVARGLALIGALGIGAAVARADEESDLDQKHIRATERGDRDQTSEDERSDSDSDRSSRSSRSTDDDSDDSSSRSRSSRANRHSDDSDDDSGSSSRRARSSRHSDDMDDDSDSSSSRSQRNRGDHASSQHDQHQGQHQEVGAEFDSGDNHQLTVSDVEEDSLAGRAGLHEDDRIISVDGYSFRDTDQLDHYLSQAGNRRVPIIIERNGRRYTVTLNQNQQQNRGQQNSQFRSNQYGSNQFRTNQYSNNQQSQNDTAWLGVYLDDNEDGVEVTRVYPNGPAARAGIRPGDVIIQINGEDVTDSDELVERIEDQHPQSRAHFTVLRDDREITLNATLASRNAFTGGQQSQQQQYASQQSSWQQDDSNRGQRNQQGFANNQQQRFSNQRRYSNQNAQYNQDQYNQDQDNDGSYSTYSSAPRSNQRGQQWQQGQSNQRGQQWQQGSRQSSDRIERLEHVVHELSQEVHDLRRQLDNQ